MSGGGFTFSNGKVDHVQMRIHYTPPPSEPSDPTGASATQDLGSDSVTITWTDNASDEDNYEVQRNIDSAGWVSLTTSLAANTTSYTDSDISKDGSYQYRVRALKTSGPDSGFSTASAITVWVYTGKSTVFYYQ